ncbi:hypothetical protein M0805_008772 [Coniferiporia weirii]|nr:hypothetical protein M0805_008772 [Coniferiporia weirii]
MPSFSSNNSPWPAQTPLPPSPSPAVKRKRSVSDRHSRSVKHPRATIANQTQIDQAKALCFDTGNAVLSCWPTSDTIVDQNEATQFVWNSNQPSFAQFNLVNIALFRADTGATIKTYNNTPNPTNRAGSLPITVDDDWWGANGASWSGEDTPFEFFFAIVQNGTNPVVGLPQATFTAIQTTFANSVIASMSSTAAAAASSSAAAASSSRAASLSSLTASPTSGGLSSTSTASDRGGDSGLQDSSGGSSFPHWAIAVIVVLGFFALAALIALVFLLIARARRRRVDSMSRRGSMGSQSPMMQNVQPTEPPQSPMLEHPAGFGAGAVLGGVATGRAASIVSPDGASTHSDNLFSGADAAVMAEAFRKALRKPEFGDQPMEEGDSPDAMGDEPGLLRSHLAEEGRDIRSVGSSRDVRVETLSDGADGNTTARNSLA